MRACLLLTVVLFAPARGDDPKMPANMNLPSTALAKAAADPKGGTTITLRLLSVAPGTATRKGIVHETVTKVVNGKQVTEVVPVEKEFQITVMKPTGWRELKFGAADKGVTIHDTAGKPVAADKVAALLAKEVPVLVSMTGEAIDPFHLLTAKEGTLVFVVPGHILYPPPPGPVPTPVQLKK